MNRFLIICLLSLPFSIYGQQLPLTHFSEDDPFMPLPGKAVTSMYEDEFGFIWMGIYGTGLVRYDGQSFEEIPINTLADADNFLTDSQGRLWVGGDQGLIVSEKSLDNYHTSGSITFLDSLDGVSFPDLSYWLMIDGKQQVWAISDTAIIKYRYNDLQKLEADTVAFSNSKVFSDEFAQPMIRRDGSFWIGQIDKGYQYAYDEDSSKLVEKFKFPSAKPHGIPELLYEDTNGFLWAGNEHHYSLFNREMERINLFQVAGKKTDIIQVDEKTILMGVRGKGLWEIDMKTGKLIRDYGLKEGLPNLEIHGLLKDKPGNIWIAHSFGVSRMPADYRAFQSYVTSSFSKLQTQADIGVAKILPDLSWGEEQKPFTFLASTQGLIIIDEKGDEEFISGDFLPLPIIGLCADREGRIWITSSTRGLHCLYPEGKKGKYPFRKGTTTSLTLFDEPYNLSFLPSGFPYLPATMPLMNPDGSSEESLWVFSKERAQFIIKDEWMWIEKESGYDFSFPPVVVNDSAGTVFIKAEDKLVKSIAPLTMEGYQKLYEKSATFLLNVNYVFRPNQEVPFFEKMHLHWQQDTFTYINNLLWHKDKLWVATENSLLMLAGENFQSIANIDLSDSLAISNLVFNPQTNSIWASREDGLLEFDIESFKLKKHIHPSDGMLGSQSWGPEALSVGKDGAIYYGIDKGVVIYRPELDQEETTDFPIFFRETTFEQDLWGRNEFTARFASLALKDEKTITYRTRLKGYEKDWLEETKESELRYMNLPAYFFPKTYSLEVMAKDYRGNWITKAEPFSFKVTPALWLTWWAFLFYTVIIGVFVKLFLDWRMREYAKKLKLEEAETIKVQRDQIAQQNAEKELLLKEIHHRVKNNLQTISSLLHLQSAQIEDDSIRAAVSESQNRVQSMALIHQKLYQRENLAAIEMKDYLANLGKTLINGMRSKGKEIALKIDMEKIELDVDSAIPIGLIVNELITNSLKYAFEDMNEGEIRISMISDSPDVVQLIVSDNGVGAKEGESPKGTAFGSQLVQMLCMQLGGKMETISENGFMTKFDFKYVKRIG